MIGIYKIENKRNKKIYLVRARNIKNSIYALKSKLRKNRLTSYNLQHDWNFYQENDFSFQVIEQCNLKDLNSCYEKHKLLNKDNLYNPSGRKKHPWNLYPVVINLAPKTELILDADGDLLPLKFCIQCELHKLEDSFLSNSFYCRSCREQIEDENNEIEEIFGSY